MKGKPCSEKTRAKISVAQKGKKRPPSEKHRAAMSVRKGKPHSEEHRAKLRKAVVIKILETGSELVFSSALHAEKAMGICHTTISKLANHKMKKSKCKRGEYASAFFTARFRD